MTLQPTDRISCRESVAMVSALRDHELGAADQVRLDQHVAHCSSCQVARQQFDALFGALDALLKGPVA